jgi:hypothetical protein
MIGGMKYSGDKAFFIQFPSFCCAALKSPSYNSACFFGLEPYQWF